MTLFSSEAEVKVEEWIELINAVKEAAVQENNERLWRIADDIQYAEIIRVI